MREDPNLEFGRLDMEHDFGFGVNPSEHDMIQDKIHHAIHGAGLFDEQMEERRPPGKGYRKIVPKYGTNLFFLPKACFIGLT